MPITLDIKKDVQEAVMEAIIPLLQKIEELESKISGNTDELIDIKEVSEIVGLSKSTIYRMVAEKKFPAYIKIGPKTTKWRKSEILRYVSSKQ